MWWCGHLVKLQAPNLDLVRDDHFLLSRSMITTCGFCSHRDQRQVPAIKVIIQSNQGFRGIQQEAGQLSMVIKIRVSGKVILPAQCQKYNKTSVPDRRPLLPVRQALSCLDRERKLEHFFEAIIYCKLPTFYSINTETRHIMFELSTITPSLQSRLPQASSQCRCHQ